MWLLSDYNDRGYRCDYDPPTPRFKSWRAWKDHWLEKFGEEWTPEVGLQAEIGWAELNEKKTIELPW